MSVNTLRLSNIELIKVSRLSTGIPCLDMCYGTTIDGNYRCSGLPRGGVSLWAGSGGVGKSRVAIAIASYINSTGGRVLYIQNEVNPQQFREWTRDKIANPYEFLVHTSNIVDQQIQAMLEYKPHLVVIDSINMIPNFQSVNVIRETLEKYRSTTSQIQSHLILIGHLNKVGTVKGNNDITYLVDTQCGLQYVSNGLSKNHKLELQLAGKSVADMFFIVVEKNRYNSVTINGEKYYVCFRHTNESVQVVCSNAIL